MGPNGIAGMGSSLIGGATTRRGAVVAEALEDRRLLSGTWAPLTSGAPGPLGTMLLLPDGSVMAQVNGDNPGNGWAKLTPTGSGSYVAGSWTTLAPMQYTRLFESSQVLRSGKVFVAGGEYGTGGSNGELYDPTLNTWVSLAPQSFGQLLDANSILLPDGRVMIAPVSPSTAGGTILFDPTSDTWSPGPALFRGESADELSWVKLPDDSIIMVDGPNISERYVPSLNQWINDATVPVNLFDSLSEEGPAFLLPQGQAFFIGAGGQTAIYTPSGTAAPGTWAAGPSLPLGLGADDAPAAMMPDGNILMALGPAGTESGPTTFCLYNPSTNTISTVPGLKPSSAPYVGRMLMLPDGTVLYTDGTAAAWEYNPGEAPLAAAKATISSVTPNADGTFTLTGTNLNGISAGASYGDDAQMDTNYPLVRLTDPSGTVTYARTFNWSSTGVMTGSATESVEFVAPGGITNALQVVVNGVASDPIYPNGRPGIPTVVTPATPSATTVSGTSTNLSVLGSNPSGPESSLTYTWVTTSMPTGVTPPSFSVNAVNAAKNTTVAFYAAGRYVLQAIIQSPNGLYTTSSVVVTVTPTDSGVTLLPDRATVTSGGTVQLHAQEVDQFGLPMGVGVGFTWSVLSGGGTINSSGLYTAPATGTLATISATDGTFSGTGTVGVVPAPWADTDIGAVGLSGLASAGNGTFTITGSGANIATASDQCQFLYQRISGDVTITARVTSEQNTGDFAYAGLMIRNSLLANDAFVAVNLTPASRTDFSSRGAVGTFGSYTETNGSPVPYWLRLVRTGNTIRAYRSPDGTGWMLIGTASFPITTAVYVGLDVCAHTNSATSTSTIDNVSIGTAAVIGRSLFYNNSAFDGNDPSINPSDTAAIATDKAPLTAGNVASFANYTSYAKGINGLMVDIQDLPATPALSDFTFRVGNSTDVSTWAAAAAVSSYKVLAGAGVNGSSRIEFTWPDGAIRNRWLQVTVAADSATGLLTPDVFYFGNLVGSAAATVSSGSFVVTSADMNSARNDSHSFLSPAPITDINDFNRDGQVDALDQLIARMSAGATLLQFSPAPIPPPSSGSTLIAPPPDPLLTLRKRRVAL